MIKTNPRELILRIKEARDNRGLSYNDIIRIMEDKGIYPVSIPTLSRVFAEGSEEDSFSFEKTIVPIYNALFDIEEIGEEDDMNVQAMKTLLKFKLERMEELENEIERLNSLLDKEKIKYHDRLEKERADFKRRTDFLTHQIDLKDKRMDQLLEAFFAKDQQHKEMLELILTCPARVKAKGCD